MKKLIILVAVLLLVAACGSDVTDPSETSYDAKYVIKTLGGESRDITIMYSEGAGVLTDTLEVNTSEWSHEFTAMPGDTLLLHGDSNDPDIFLEAYLYIDDEYTADDDPGWIVGICYFLE